MNIKKNTPNRILLTKVLWDIQKKRRYISPDDISKIAKEYNISKVEVEGVVSFYHFFHLSDAGKYTVYLNSSIVSKIKNFQEVKKAFEKETGTKFGKVTKDKLFGLFETSCVGLSDQESAALINYRPFTKLTPEKVKFIVSELKKGVSVDKLCDVPNNTIRYKPGKSKTVFFRKYIPFDSLKNLEKFNPDEVIEIVKKSKLSGRGGAFFPTGLKWQLCKQQPEPQKYIICNADEGEPGTFKDRVLLNNLPGLLIEGMIMAAYAVGASQGFIYLRAEYSYLEEKLQKTIDSFYENGFLGNNINAKHPFNFNIELFMGAGAYVCGEETALINSMEGKRGEPSLKEYFPIEKGYLKKPTVVNNVETLCAVPRIFEIGVDNYLAIGTPLTPGTKLMSVSGDCGKPGIYEIEWGMKLHNFLNLIEAEEPHFILYNGFAGECLSLADFDREISGENLLAEHIQFELNDPISYSNKMRAVGLRSGGSFIVFNKNRPVLQTLKNISDFFVNESCGVCVPCRTGNFLLNKKINKILLGHANTNDLDDIKEWSSIIKHSSRCGLGKTAPNCLLSAMLKFPTEFEQYLQAESDINSAFDLKKATNNYTSIIKDIETIYG